MALHHVFLGLGSNLGDKKKNLEKAFELIEKWIGKIVSKSTFYITQPEGFFSESMFMNSVCEVVSDLSIDTLFAMTQSIEKQLGRVEKSKNGVYTDRWIDIDILMIDDRIINSQELIVPHPQMHLRKFVLIPFAEIAPDKIHPVLKKTIQELLRQLP